MSIKIAPSVLSADFGRLAEEIAMAEQAGAEVLHLDVMDAHFVPNLTFGPMIVKAIRNLTGLTLDAHLLITEPDTYLDAFIEAGADAVDFHLEAFEPSERQQRATAILDRLKEAGVGRGIAVNPDTPVEWVYPYLEQLDSVLIMTVHPGFGGQKLIAECLEKISLVKAEAARLGVEISVGVDGGVNLETAAEVVAAGADVLVAGSAIFHAPDPPAVIRDLRSAETAA